MANPDHFGTTPYMLGGMETRKTFSYSIDALATELGLPRKYLRDLAHQKKIPCLNVGGRLRFNPAAVADALDRLSQMAVDHGESGPSCKTYTAAAGICCDGGYGLADLRTGPIVR